MKRFVVLSLCVLLGTAMVAKAEVIRVTETRSVYNATYDEVDLTVASITGSEVPAGDYCTGLKGAWTLPTGGYFALNTSGTAWPSKLTNDNDLQDVAAGVSWIDLGLYVSADTHTRTGENGTNTAQWNSFTITLSADGGSGGYYNYFLGPVDMTPGDDGSGLAGTNFDNTLLAKFYVTHATPSLEGKTIFSGVGGYALPQSGGVYAGQTTQVVVGTPEPCSLALLGCSLFGLVAYAWRKRK